MNLLELKNVSLGYSKKVILKNVHFSLREGGITAFLGPNGSGKTTLLKSILGDIKPLSGEIVLAPNLKMGYVSQFDQEGSFWPLSAGEYISLFCKDRKVVEEAMASIGISELYRENLQSLSGGQHRKVLLAKALVNRPDLLILDEPTQEMDIASELDYLELLRELNHQGTGILIVTHLLPVATAIAEDIVLVHEQKAVSTSIVNLTSELERMYGRPFAQLSHEGTPVFVPGGKKHD